MSARSPWSATRLQNRHARIAVFAIQHFGRHPMCHVIELRRASNAEPKHNDQATSPDLVCEGRNVRRTLRIFLDRGNNAVKATLSMHIDYARKRVNSLKPSSNIVSPASCDLPVRAAEWYGRANAQ